MTIAHFSNNFFFFAKTWWNNGVHCRMPLPESLCGSMVINLGENGPVPLGPDSSSGTSHILRAWSARDHGKEKDEKRSLLLPSLLALRTYFLENRRDVWVRGCSRPAALDDFQENWLSRFKFDEIARDSTRSAWEFQAKREFEILLTRSKFSFGSGTCKPAWTSANFKPRYLKI